MVSTVDDYFKPSVPGSYAGASTFRRHHPEYKPNELADILRGYRSYTLHKPVRHKFHRNQIIVGGIDAQWEIDLADMQKYTTKNENNNYLFCVIDVFSKKAWCIPTKRKAATDMADAFEKLMNKTDRRCKYIRTDKGTEFTNRLLQNKIKKYGIRFFTNKNDDAKCSIIERFLRTLKGRIQRYMVHNRTERYVDVLDEIIDSYNNTYHRTINTTPNNVSKANEATIWARMYRDGNLNGCSNFKLRIGDHVRIKMSRRPFQKGYEGQWSEEIFKIVESIPRIPPVYRLVDLNSEPIDGTFYEYEIQKVTMRDDVFSVERVIKTRRRNGKTQYFVKWLGYNDSFNSWTDDIL